MSLLILNIYKTVGKVVYHYEKNQNRRRLFCQCAGTGAGVLGIRIVGKASDQGTLEPTDKCRGEAKSLSTLVTRLKENGLSEGRVQIAHCRNEQAALKLKSMIEAQIPGAAVAIGENRGLCSYYAELGGILVGYEKR